MMAATAPDTFIDNAKVMAKGQVTIPKDVRTPNCNNKLNTRRTFMQ